MSETILYFPNTFKYSYYDDFFHFGNNIQTKQTFTNKEHGYHKIDKLLSLWNKYKSFFVFRNIYPWENKCLPSAYKIIG